MMRRNFITGAISSFAACFIPTKIWAKTKHIPQYTDVQLKLANECAEQLYNKIWPQHKEQFKNINYLGVYSDPRLTKYHKFGWYCWMEYYNRGNYFEPIDFSFNDTACYATSIDCDMSQMTSAQAEQMVELIKTKIMEKLFSEKNYTLDSPST